MRANPYSTMMTRAREALSAKGHLLGDWTPLEDGEGFVAACANCSGIATVTGDPQTSRSGPDPWRDVGICSGASLEFRQKQAKEQADFLVDLYKFILSWPDPEKQSGAGSSSDSQ